jgi:hypothetical protein
LTASAVVFVVEKVGAAHDLGLLTFVADRILFRGSATQKPLVLPGDVYCRVVTISD